MLVVTRQGVGESDHRSMLDELISSKCVVAAVVVVAVAAVVVVVVVVLLVVKNKEFSFVFLFVTKVS